jgi:hypothetical protein
MLMKTPETKQSGARSDQRGFASIVIAMVLVLVLSLLTVGFAELMRHEQRSALDKQLSGQAYYAAESGINDAAAAISVNPTLRKDTCGPTAGPSSPLPSNVVGTRTGSSYPCLLINPTPLTLEYAVGTGQAKIAEMQGVDSAGNPKAVGSIIVSWEDSGGATNFVPAAGNRCNGNATNTFLPISAPSGPTWNYTGVLRTQIVPIHDLNRDALTNATFTAFLCPLAGSGTPTSVPYGDDTGQNGGGVISGACKTGTANARYCNMRITGLGALNESTFILALRSIYNPTTVTIKLFGADAASTPLNIALAQVLVDSTGKAQNVLKRVQVRIPAHNGYAVPDDGTQAMDSICKQLQLTPESVPASARGGGSDCSP